MKISINRRRVRCTFNQRPSPWRAAQNNDLRRAERQFHSINKLKPDKRGCTDIELLARGTQLQSVAHETKNINELYHNSVR